MQVKCSCISPARTLYEAKAPRTPLRIESATPTIKPISAHLPIALARTGVVFWKHRNRIRPITGNKNARMFRTVDGLSSCWLDRLVHQLFAALTAVFHFVFLRWYL